MKVDFHIHLCLLEKNPEMLPQLFTSTYRAHSDAFT